VRVHASMLRKRLEQYFADEGAHESVIIEIPKGNYAPVFRERGEVALPPSIPVPEIPIVTPSGGDRRLWALGLLASIFACSTAFLLLRGGSAPGVDDARRPNVTLFWSQVFHTNRPTDIVLDD